MKAFNIFVLSLGYVYCFNDHGNSVRVCASTFLTKETKQPLVQGVIGLDRAENIPLDSKLLIQIYESLNDTVIAGAKITLADVSFPFRFQLFEENLLISKDKWKSLGDFEQYIRVSICKEISKSECNSAILYSGEGISNSVAVGTPETEIRQIRIFPFINLTNK
eukprot:gene6553-13255_t